MKKIKVISGWVIVIAYLIVSLSFVEKKNTAITCNKVNIFILDSVYNGFVSKNDLLQIVNKHYGHVIGSGLSSINTEILEKAVLENRAIKECKIYKTADGSLNIEILQRQPVLRIINSQNLSYYMDSEGYIIPFSTIQTPDVIIANGFIHENIPINTGKQHNISDFDIPGKENILRDLHSLSTYIYNDPFWKAQFVQIYVNKKEELELIPRVGAHIIVLGKVDGYEKKFQKLKTLYVKGFNNIGWNEYEYINLKYKNQVICSKR